MNCPKCNIPLTRANTTLDACLAIHDEQNTLEVNLTCDECQCVLDGFFDIDELVPREPGE